MCVCVCGGGGIISSCLIPFPSPALKQVPRLLTTYLASTKRLVNGFEKQHISNRGCNSFALALTKNIHAHSHTYTHTRTHTHSHSHTRTYTHARTHAHAQTHTHTPHGHTPRHPDTQTPIHPDTDTQTRSHAAHTVLETNTWTDLSLRKSGRIIDSDTTLVRHSSNFWCKKSAAHVAPAEKPHPLSAEYYF